MTKRTIDQVGETNEITREENIIEKVIESANEILDAELLLTSDNNPEIDMSEDEVYNLLFDATSNNSDDIVIDDTDINKQDNHQLPNVLYYKRLKRNTIILNKSANGLGYDLKTPFAFHIGPQDYKIINLGLKVKIPPGKHGRIVGLYNRTLEEGVDIVNGIIDEEYLDDLKICIINRSDKVASFYQEETIAQLIIEKHYSLDVEERHALHLEYL